MEDKCPKCGSLLVTKTIKKQLGSGSIDYPVAQTCPKCGWSRDLTGAGDIVAKPPVVEEVAKKEAPAAKPLKPAEPKPSQAKPAPQKAAPLDANKLITVVLVLLVIVGIAWTFLPKGQEPIAKGPSPTPTIAATPAVTQMPVIEVTPTGNKTQVKIDRDRGYVNPAQKNLKIKPGDEVIWANEGSYALTLISREGLFEDKLLDYGKVTNYTFKKTGTFNFDIKVRDVIKFSGTVAVEP